MPVPVPFDAQYDAFLTAEQTAMERLQAFYGQAQSELYDFLLNPPAPLTASEQAFYAALDTKLDETILRLSEGASSWIEQSVPAAFAEGALQHAPGMVFTAIHEQAVQALSGYSLGLITQMNDGMRAVIRQQIGVGLLEGATREVVSQRLVASGLTNIPHWRSVQERAAVIARTEVMRAYNHGNFAGILSTGAHMVRWITGRDERVCPICGPRDRVTFRLGGTFDGTPAQQDAFFALPMLSEVPPAHPRCRCTIRAAYELPEGGGTTIGTPTEPTPPPGGIIESQPKPYTGIASPADDFDTQLAKLKARNFPTTQEYEAASAYWRDLSLADGETMRKVAEAVGDYDVAGFVFDARYGVQFTAKGPKELALWAENPEFRFHILNGIERYRSVFPRNITGSSYWKRLEASSGLGISTLADCSTNGTIRLSMPWMLKHSEQGAVRSIAFGPDETIAHELGHALHNRFGIPYKHTKYGPVGHEAIELGGGRVGLSPELTKLWNEWGSIRRRSRGGIWQGGVVKWEQTIGVADTRIAAYEKAIAEWDSLPRSTKFVRRWNAQTGRMVDVPAEFRTISYVEDGRAIVEDFENVESVRYMIETQAQAKKLAQAKIASIRKGVEHYPTEYAKENEREDFAESMMLYLIDPARLRQSSPLRYAFLRDRILEGAEA